jgi:hypothetical protein
MRDPSPFDFAQGQDDGFKRNEMGTSIVDLLREFEPIATVTGTYLVSRSPQPRRFTGKFLRRPPK